MFALLNVHRCSRLDGFTTRPERVTRSVAECSVFGWLPCVGTAVVDPHEAGVEGSAGRFFEMGVETMDACSSQAVLDPEVP